MLRKILSYGFVEAIAKGLNKLILLLLPFFLTTVDFGKVGLIVSVETLLPLLSLLGFERVILRFYHQKEDFTNFDKTVSYSILYSHIILLILIALAYLLGYRTILGLEIVSDWFLLLILVYLQGINTLTLNKYRVSERHKDYFKTRLFLQVGKFIFVLLLVLITKNYLAYLTGGIIVAIITNIFYTIKESNKTEKFNSKTFKYFLGFSWPFIFHGISMNLLGNADKFIIEKILNLSEVGLYTFIYSIGSMVVFAFIGVSVYMEPLIYKVKNNKQKENLLFKFKSISIIVGLFMYIIITVVSIYILPDLYKNYASVVNYIPYIALSHLLFPYYLSANYRMIYDKKTIRVAITSIIACAVNIGLNFYLIPIYGIYAAVLVTFISYFIQALGFVFVSNNFKITNELFEIIIFGIVLFLFINFKIHYLIVSLVVVLYLFLLKKVKKGEIYEHFE